MQKSRTVTKADLIAVVYIVGGLSRNEAHELTTAIIAEISDRLIHGEALSCQVLELLTFTENANGLAEIQERWKTAL